MGMGHYAFVRCLRYDALVESGITIVLARWWGYLLIGSIAAFAVAALGWLLVRGSAGYGTGDFAIVGSGFALALAGLAAALAYAFKAPRLILSNDGVVLLTPVRRRRWAWSQVCEVRVTRGRGAHAEFRWRAIGEAGEDGERVQSLDCSFSPAARLTCDTLVAARTAALAGADFSEIAAAVDRARAEYRPERLGAVVPFVALFLLADALVVIAGMLAHRR